jgi:hypothetical protein
MLQIGPFTQNIHALDCSPHSITVNINALTLELVQS